MTAKIMRWTMESWQRIQFMNRYLFGTLAPRLQLDLIPGVMCAAHYAIVAEQVPTTREDYLQAGRVMQRVWLTATQLGLSVQPEMTPLIFARYLREGTHFTDDSKVQQLSRHCSEQYKELLGSDADKAIFIGRMGDGEMARSRSTRKPLEGLMRQKK